MLAQFKNGFSTQGISHAINICKFEEYTNRPDLQLKALRYLYQYGNGQRNCPNLSDTATKMLKIFYHKKDIVSIRELVDIVNTFSKKEGKKLLEFLRQEDIKNSKIVQLQQPTIKKELRTVYSDSQNVHNSKINKSVVETAEKLCEMFKDILNVKENNHKNNLLDNISTELIKKFPTETDVIIRVIEYIRTNTAYFGTSKITLQDTLISVWLWISFNKNFDVLQSRLLEELKEMDGQCTTGHIARLINVIQGFTEDEKFCIKISDEDRYKSIIYTYLNKELKNCQDSKVIDGIYDCDNNYKQFIITKTNQKIPEWTKVGMSMNTIHTTVNSFSKIKIY